MTFYRLLLFLPLIVLASCSGSKETTSNSRGKNLELGAVSNETKITAERLFFDAQREKLVGNVPKAAELFEQVVKLTPNNDAAHYELSQIYLAKGEFLRAKEELNKAIDIDEDNLYYLEMKGSIMAASYDFGEAALVYGKLRSKSPQKIEYFFKEALYLGKNNQLKEARAVLDELESRIGLQEGIATERHLLFLREGKLEEAAAELKALVDSDPDNPEYILKLADFYIENGREAEGEALYKRMIELDPDDAIAITALADYYKKIGDNEGYREYTLMAFANSNVPLDAKISILYNYIQAPAGDTELMEEAFELGEVLKESHPDEAKVFAIVGDLHNINDNVDSALIHYRRSLQLQKDIYSVWQQVFFLYSDEQEYDSLIVVSNEAKEYFPNQPTVYFFNGLGYHQTEDYEKAVKSYNKGLKMTVDNAVMKAQFHSNLGDAYNSLKEYEDSDANYEAALEIEPDNAYVLNNYSYYLSLRNEKLDKAAEMSARSNELEKNNSSFLDTYAWIMYKQGKYKEAETWQQKALDASLKPSATLLEHMGDILYKQGRKEEALNFWKSALDAGSDSDQLPRKIADKQLYE